MNAASSRDNIWTWDSPWRCQRSTFLKIVMAMYFKTDLWDLYTRVLWRGWFEEAIRKPTFKSMSFPLTWITVGMKTLRANFSSGPGLLCTRISPVHLTFCRIDTLHNSHRVAGHSMPCCVFCNSAATTFLPGSKLFMTKYFVTVCIFYLVSYNYEVSINHRKKEMGSRTKDQYVLRTNNGYLETYQ